MAVTTLQKVLDIQLNYKSTVTHLKELQNRIEACDDSMAKLKQDFKDGTIGIDEYNRGMAMAKQAKKQFVTEEKNVTKAMQMQISRQRESIDSINNMTQRLEVLKQKYMQMSEAQRNSARGQALLDGIKSYSAQIKAATDKLKPDTFAAAADSINGLNNRMKELVQQYNNLDKVQRKGAQGKQMREEIAKLNKEIEREKNLLSNSKKSFGQYSDSIVALRVKLSNLKTEFYNLSKAERDGFKGDVLRKHIQDITKDLNKAEQSIGVFGRNVGNYKSALQGLGKMSSVFNNLFFRLGLGVLGFGQGVIQLNHAIREGISLSIEYNREVSKLAAILNTNAQGVAHLTAEAKRLGSTTRYTAREVVQLETELAKLGYKQSQILNMTESVLHFGQATGSELADAASLAGAALRMFELPSIEITNVVDKMSAATTNSALNFQYLATALPIVGGVANTFGFKLEEVLSLLGQLANAGMDASMAATATRNIFLKMADSSGELARQLGHPVTNIHEMVKGLQDLKARGANLNDILELTNVRAANAFSIFLRSTEQTEDLYTAIENSNGATEKMAKTMEDNLGGSLKTLSSVWEDLLLSINGSQGWLRDLVDWLAKKVKGIADDVRSVEESISRLSNEFVDFYSNENGEQMQMWNEDDMNSYYDALRKNLAESLKQLGLEGDAIDKEIQKYEKYMITRAKIKEIESKLGREDISEEESNRLNTELDNLKRSLDFGQEELRMLSEAETKAVQAVRKEIQDYQKELNKLYQDARAKRLQKEKAGEQFGISDMNNDKVRERIAELEKELAGRQAYGTTDVSTSKAAQELALLKEVIALRKEEARLLGASKSQDTRIELLNANTKQDVNRSGLGIEDPKALQREKSAEKQRLAAEQALENALLDMAKENAFKRQQMIEVQYDQEIQQIRYKIEEELKMRGDESERERQQKEEAIASYEQLILVKEQQRQDAIARLNNEEIIKETEYLTQLYSLRLAAVEKGTDEEFDLRMKSLSEQEKAEIAQLELDADKDLRIKEELEQRKTAIQEKYNLERRKLVDENTDTLTDRALADYQNQILKQSNNEIEQARITADMKRYIYDNMYQKIGESEEAFALRQQQAMMDLYNAENDVNKKIEESQQRLFTIRMNYANSEIERLAIDKEAKKSYYENLTQWQGESYEAYAERVSKAHKDYVDSQRALSNAQMQIASSTANALSGMFGTIGQAIEDCGEKNEANARRAKILGLAEVYITQGMAVAQAIHKAWSTSSNWIEAIAATAAGVATVISSTVQAISSIKKAKLAHGAVNIQGQGSETSDSIPAQLSRGESVMTAKATKMFGGLLYAMNKFAAQPSYTLPNMYSSYNPAQITATRDELGTSMRDAMKEIRPVVSVTEINEVSTRLSHVKVLDNI